MITLTAPLKRSITSDWKTKFHNLDVYKPMWLGRLVGPFFHGIRLERSSGNNSYLPISHIHCLCRDFPVVSLTLSQDLLSKRSGTQERISAQFHEAHFPQAAVRLREASLLPFADSWGLRDLIAATDRYQKLGRSDANCPVSLFESVVLAAAWLGDLDKAEASLAKYEAIASSWPENILARCGGHHAWADSLRRLFGNPNALREAADLHAEKLKVIQLPKVEMLS